MRSSTIPTHLILCLSWVISISLMVLATSSVHGKGGELGFAFLLGIHSPLSAVPKPSGHPLKEVTGEAPAFTPNRSEFLRPGYNLPSFTHFLEVANSFNTSSKLIKSKKQVFAIYLCQTKRDGKEEETLSDVGPVRRCFMVMQKGSTEHCGFGFIQFVVAEDANHAIELKNGTRFEIIIFRLGYKSHACKR